MTIAIDRRWIVVAVTAALGMGGLGYWVGHRGSDDGEITSSHGHARYQCSMHPEIVSDKPGDCPICGMRLQKVDDAAAVGTKSGERKILFYRHPMRPDVTSPTPNKDEMGMDYIAVYSDEAASATAVPGHAGFSIPLERQQLIGVKTAKAEIRQLDVEIRAVGRVAYDPELYNAIEEYMQAAAAREKIKESPLPDARRGADALLRSASTRLRLLGMSPDQIVELSRDGADPINLLLPDKTAWIYAEVYEYEVDALRPGLELTAVAPSMPGRTYRGKIVSIDSVVNAQTRTARVRALVQTPNESLRPEAFVNVKVHLVLGKRLAVPEDSVLDTGERQLVFVRKGEGEFEPREVKLGRQASGYYEVKSGVSAGEEVVTAANFLIDSESRFRAALSAFGGTVKSSGTRPAAGGKP